MAEGLGLIIFGIILAVVGYVFNRHFAEGIIKTLSYVAYVIGVVLVFIGIILLALGLAGII